MGIEIKQGRKHPEDKVILVNGYMLSFVEILEIILLQIRNEDLIYPVSKGFKGGALLQEFYIRFIGEKRLPDDSEMKYFKLGKYRPKSKGV